MFIGLVPEQYQECLRNRMSSAPVDVKGIASDLNIPVREDFIQGAGYLLSEGNGRFSIYVSMFDELERQRFTIAHELSHFFLHRRGMRAGAAKSRGLTDGYMSSEERDANILAAEILMPFDLLKAESRREDINSIEDLAKVFEVSIPAMQIRLGVRDAVGENNTH